jgi:hypothetical protein
MLGGEAARTGDFDLALSAARAGDEVLKLAGTRGGVGRRGAGDASGTGGFNAAAGVRTMSFHEVAEICKPD